MTLFRHLNHHIYEFWFHRLSYRSLLTCLSVCPFIISKGKPSDPASNSLAGTCLRDNANYENSGDCKKHIRRQDHLIEAGIFVGRLKTDSTKSILILRASKTSSVPKNPSRKPRISGYRFRPLWDRHWVGQSTKRF